MDDQRGQDDPKAIPWSSSRSGVPSGIASASMSDGSSYVAMDGSNQVASTWDVPDMEAFQAAQRSFSPELAAAAERAGMIPPVMIYIKK